MHEITCPYCTKAFKVDEAGYADILKQVRDSEFEQQLHERLELAAKDKLNAIKLAKSEVGSEMQKAASAKDTEIQALKAKLDSSEVMKKLAVTEARGEVEKERDALANELAQAKRDKQALVNRMGIDPDKNWAANYQILPGKEKVVNELRKLAKDADTIYLATDLDREGEAIAWHLKEIIGDTGAPYKRVVFNEITKSAIKEAFETPAILDQARVDAQQARRFLDRVVGFMVSPLLWAKIARGLSAGRVQSVAVRLVVDREAEIRAFIPEEFWETFSHLVSQDGEAIRFQVVKQEGKEYKPVN